MADVIYKVSVAGINESVKSLDDMDAVLKQLIKRFGELNIATQQGLRQDVAKEIQNISALKKQYSDWNQTLHNTANSVNQAGMTLQGLNYVVRDSPYFFQNMNLGIMAVGNNINPLIDSFIRLRLQAVEMSAATGKSVTAFGLLRQQLMGAGGIMLGFSLLVTAIQAYSFAMNKAGKDTEKTSEAIGKITNEFTKLKDAIDGNKQAMADMEQGIFSKAIMWMGIMSGITPNALKNRLEEWKDLIFQNKILNGTIDEQNRIAQISSDLRNKDKASILSYIKANQLNSAEIGKVIERLKEEQARFPILSAGYKEYAQTIKNIQDIINPPKDDKVKKKGLGGEADLLREVEGVEKRVVELRREATWELEKQVELIRQIGFAGFLGRKVSMVKETQKPEIELTKEETKAVQEQLQMINDIANTAGNAISNAFLSGKNAIDAATQALLQFVTQLLVVQTIKGVLNLATGGVGGFLGGFLGFANGGIVQANNGLVVGGNSYAGDRILAGVNSGEMILNRTQQARLFKQINSGGGSQTIEVVGRLKADKNNFVAEVENAQKTYNKKIKVANIGRS